MAHANNYVESHVSLAGHPKTKRLARALKCSIPTVLGHLHLFWHWAFEYAPDGDLTEFDYEDIAEAALWEGDAATFVEGMIQCGIGDRHGFLEVGEGNRLLIHDWQEYGGKLHESRQRNAEKVARFRSKEETPPQEEKGNSDQSQASQVTSSLRNRNVTVTSPLPLRRGEEIREEETRQDKTRQDKTTGARPTSEPVSQSSKNISAKLERENRGRFIADTLSEHPHWQTPLAQSVASAEPVDVPAYQAKVLKNWLDGDGTPPEPGSKPPPERPEQPAPRVLAAPFHAEHHADPEELARITRADKAQQEAFRARRMAARGANANVLPTREETRKFIASGGGILPEAARQVIAATGNVPPLSEPSARTAGGAS